MKQQIFERSQTNTLNNKSESNRNKNNHNNPRIAIKKVASQSNLLNTCSQTNEQYFQNCANSTKVNPTPPYSVRGLIHKIKSVQRVGINSSPNNNPKYHQKREIILEQKRRDLNKNQQFTMPRYNNIIPDKRNLLNLVKQAVQLEQQRLRSNNATVYQQIKLIKKELLNLDEENYYLKQSIAELQQQNKNLNQKIIEIVNDITILNTELQQKEQEIKQYKLKQSEQQINNYNRLQQLNTVVQSLKKQNQYLVNQINFINNSKPNLQMNINSKVLQTTIIPSLNKKSQIDIKEKQLQQLEHQIINLQRRNYTNINRINKEHEKQIQSLKNTFFKSLNYYKSMLMKCTTNSFVDFSKYPEDLLETAIMEVDQQGDQYLGGLEDIKID